MTLYQIIKSDYSKHHNYGAGFFVIIFFTQGFWAAFQYRIANYIHVHLKFKPLRVFFLAILVIWKKIIEILTGISISGSATIDHSFYIGHFGGIIINADAIIGNNCNISQGVTIGISGIGTKRGVPVIGNNVYIGANSVVAGKITIGDNVLIGACSMVNRSLPDNVTVLGVPAVIVYEKGSKGYI